jgi:hypothetical protein
MPTQWQNISLCFLEINQLEKPLLLHDLCMILLTVHIKYFCPAIGYIRQATIGIDFLSKTMYLEDKTVRLQL